MRLAMYTHKKFLTGYKLAIGLLGLSAIVTEIMVLINRGRFNPVNFFSYFTVESNIIICVAFFLAAWAFAGGEREKYSEFRRAATVYILIVGLGFSLLLAGLENTEFTAVPWDNLVLHYIVPAAALLDLLLDRPKQKTAFSRSLVWLLFPVLYAVYSLIRGAITGWYPYPFLNPGNKGWGVVIVAVSAMCVLGLGVTYGVSRINAPKQH